MSVVLSRQKNDINILADKAEQGFICVKESKWSQVMPGSSLAVDHKGASLCREANLARGGG